MTVGARLLYFTSIDQIQYCSIIFVVIIYESGLSLIVLIIKIAKFRQVKPTKMLPVEYCQKKINAGFMNQDNEMKTILWNSLVHLKYISYQRFKILFCRSIWFQIR